MGVIDQRFGTWVQQAPFSAMEMEIPVSGHKIAGTDDTVPFRLPVRLGETL
jgi:hypothetical protein